MRLIARLRHGGHIHDEIAAHFRRRFEDSGRAASAPARILDLPAGEGDNAVKLLEAGFAVEAADLFPERCQLRFLLTHIGLEGSASRPRALGEVAPARAAALPAGLVG